MKPQHIPDAGTKIKQGPPERPNSDPALSQFSARPVWLKISDAVRIFGIGKTSIFTLIREGRIKSRLFKIRRDALHGIRLVSFDSLEAYITALPENSEGLDKEGAAA
jgi:hypothetical protein